MNSFILFIKGFIVGVGKVMPGVSGSLLAVSLNIYETCIKAINDLKRDFISNFLYLFKVGLGIILSIFIFSRVILYFLETYYVYTMILFIGLIFGSFFTVLKNTEVKKLKDLGIIFLSLIILLFIDHYRLNTSFVANNDFTSYFFIFLNGFIDAATMIVPGISGTSIFMMLGTYDFILSMYSNPFSNILYLICFGAGLIIGVFVVSNLVAWILDNKKEILYLFILGFAIYAMIFLFKAVLPMIQSANLLFLIILLLIGSLLAKKLND